MLLLLRRKEGQFLELWHTTSGIVEVLAERPDNDTRDERNQYSSQWAWSRFPGWFVLSLVSGLAGNAGNAEDSPTILYIHFLFDSLLSSL